MSSSDFRTGVDCVSNVTFVRSGPSSSSVHVERVWMRLKRPERPVATIRAGGVSSASVMSP
jgi:hypothetical protein